MFPSEKSRATRERSARLLQHHRRRMSKPRRPTGCFDAAQSGNDGLVLLVPVVGVLK